MAVQLIGQAARLCPQMPYFQFCLANACARRVIARRRYRRIAAADQLAGGDADALTNLGDLLREMGRLDDAAAACRRAADARHRFAMGPRWCASWRKTIA